MSFAVNAQNKQQAIYQTVTYTDWQLSNKGCYGCPSFYWKTSRSSTKINGYWKYDLWFSSNSYYQNGILSSTYVNGITLNVDGYLVTSNIWLIFKDTYTNQLLSFYSVNYQPIIYLSWEGVRIY